jgi:hypothetical protein
MVDSTNDKALKNQAQDYVDKIGSELALYDEKLKSAEDQADAVARTGRIARLKNKVQEYLYGSPDEKGSEREAYGPMTDEAAATSGGKSYENLKSSYQEIVRLAIALCYVLSALVRTGDRLGGGFYMLGLVVKPILRSIGRRLGGLNVEIHADIIKVSECGPDGKITFKPLPTALFAPGTPKDLVDQIAGMNRFVVQGLLMTHGYEADDQGVYRNDKGQILTSADFERIKNDPQTGFHQFMENYLPVTITQQPMGPRGKSAPDAEPVENQEPQHKTPAPRPF